MVDRCRRAAICILAALLLTACATATPSPGASVTPSPSPAASPQPTTSLDGSASVAPSATPEPPLSLDLPRRQNERRIRVRVDPAVAADGDGTITLTVTSLFSDRRVKELVLRWPTDLGEVLLLAPFQPSEQRIANGGPPLVQDWTKWVEGPGEHGEPAGTISLGWGPLLPGGTLTIPILVTRRAPGPVAFDLQVLARESILSVEDGGPAELRVSVP